MIKCLCLLSCFWLISFSALAQEVIHHFNVDAVIQVDGTVTITENITVTAEHDQIKRGIYRDIPTHYTDHTGKIVAVPFKIISIERDGNKEDYHSKSRSNGIRIYIGNKDKYVDVGRHQYTIIYQVKRVIGFFNTFDEFYWNVTGDQWDFPIEQAQISVVFPEGSFVIDSAAYTGQYGEKGKNYTEKKSGNQYEASITSPLKKSEGFTIAAAINKGFIAAPTAWDNRINDLKNLSAGMLLWLYIPAFILYMVYGWWRYGRDSSGIIIPRFDLPENITPDLLRYIHGQGYDHKSFITFLINQAVHGYITITQNDDAVTLLKTDKFDHHNDPRTAKILVKIFGKKDEIELPKKSSGSSSYIAKVAGAKSDHAYLLEEEKSKYMKGNGKIFLKTSIATLISIAIAYMVAVNFEHFLIFFIVSIIVFVTISGIFVHPMTKFTKKGQSLSDHAKGLKLYLGVAEKARLDAKFPPKMSIKVFEEFLPYAYALDVDQKWCEYFSDMVERNLVAEPKADYQFRWYQSSNQLTKMTSLSKGMEDISRSISSAATPPGSSGSSGSFGGGSSGGGGGGGGGGGW